MRIRILGCGTSIGVPVIGCDCRVCRSVNPRNNRMRSSIFVETDRAKILVDVTPDFRTQALREDIRHIDAVFITHEHFDHISGLDDLRPISFHSGRDVPVYCNQSTKEFIEQRFYYAFDPPQKGGGVPALDLRLLDGRVTFDDLTVTPVNLMHGRLPILGFRINNFGYVTDCSEMPHETMRQLKGLEVLVLNALRRRPHSTHLNLEQAVELAGVLGARQTYFTHMTDDLEYEEINGQLKPGFALAYDGLVIDIEDVGRFGNPSEKHHPQPDAGPGSTRTTD
jgi:phosphoribosyl 1,2-cyclic phosphate phosphodiesterase